MKVTWCWRCGVDYPMLEDHEWQVLMAAHAALPIGPQAAFSELQRQAASLGLRAPIEVTPSAPAMSRRLWHLISGFELFTQILEPSPNPIWHHHLSHFGPPCWACGRLLRTAKAQMCAYCGRQRFKNLI